MVLEYKRKSVQSKFKLNKVDFYKYCKENKVYQISLYSNVFARYEQLLCSSEPNIIDIEVKFSQDENLVNVVQGSIKTQATVLCQRCNKPFDMPIEITFKASTDKDRMNKYNFYQNYDLIEFNDRDYVDLSEYLEDLLIIEIPIVPVHSEDQNCAQGAHQWSYGNIDHIKKENPFEALKELMAKKDK